jgi:hypothetical protein
VSYQTNYTLQFDFINGEDSDYSYEELREHIDSIEPDVNLGDLVDGLTVICTWYEHEEDMLDLSRKYPEAVFILEGNGSEYPDMWKKMFINGDVEEIRPTLVWPEFRLMEREDQANVLKELL